MAAKPKSRSLRLVLIVVAIVAIIIMATVLFFVFVPSGAGKVSLKEASLSWEYSQIFEGYYVRSVTLKLTNNGRDQLFNLYVQVEGNWPVEYEYNKGFYTMVGAGLNAGETRTVSSSS
jgi:flagellar basal body-associated protein FliL